MAPSAGRAPASQPSGSRRQKPIVPVIPLPIAQKQQQLKQQRENRQRELKQQAEKKQQEAAKLEEHKKEQSRIEQDQQPATPSRPDGSRQVDNPSFTSSSTPSELPASPPVASNTSHEATASLRTESSSATTDVVSLPTVHSPNAADTSAGYVLANGAPVQNGAIPLPTRANGHAAPNFIFPSGEVPLTPASKSVLKPPQPSLHQQQPSSGSVTFGAYRGSNSASPVPNPHLPPPPPPGLVGPPPYPPFNAVGVRLDNWQGHHAVPSSGGDVNGFVPAASFNPSRAGSFHGSQSPDNIAEAAFGHHAGAFPVPVQNGGIIVARGDGPGPPAAILSPPVMSPFRAFPIHANDPHARDNIPVVDAHLVHYLQQGIQGSFGQNQTADCHILLYMVPPSVALSPGATGRAPSPADNHQPYDFIGHRAILSQSYTIAELLRHPTHVHAGPLGQPVTILPLKMDDPFISADASAQALRSLYGFPLDDVANSESASQAMDKSLANAAAGFLFMLQHVQEVALEKASEHIGWDTVEKALAFCLNGLFLPNAPAAGHDAFGMPYPLAQFRYARGTGLSIRHLLRVALDFVALNFPANFTFHAGSAAVDKGQTSLSRFPWVSHLALADTQAGSNDQNGASGRTSRSNESVSLPSRTPDAQSKHKSRSSNIVFGDFGVNGGQKTADVSAAPGSDTTAALSRVLASLPFGYLNYILGHRDLGRHASRSSSALSLRERKSVAQAVVAARESHRVQMTNYIRSGYSSVERDVILSRLESSSPPLSRQYPADGWDILGWQESCHAEGPGLVHAWTPSAPTK